MNRFVRYMAYLLALLIVAAASTTLLASNQVDPSNAGENVVSLNISEPSGGSNTLSACSVGSSSVVPAIAGAVVPLGKGKSGGQGNTGSFDTTNKDGSVTNQNHYPQGSCVYLVGRDIPSQYSTVSYKIYRKVQGKEDVVQSGNLPVAHDSPGANGHFGPLPIWLIPCTEATVEYKVEVWPPAFVDSKLGSDNFSVTPGTAATCPNESS